MHNVKFLPQKMGPGAGLAQCDLPRAGLTSVTFMLSEGQDAYSHGGHEMSLSACL